MPEEASNKCQVRLQSPPQCGDTKAVRSYAMCWARYEGQKQGMDFSTALKTGWQEAKKSCTVG